MKPKTTKIFTTTTSVPHVNDTAVVYHWHLLLGTMTTSTPSRKYSQAKYSNQQKTPTQRRWGKRELLSCLDVGRFSI